MAEMGYEFKTRTKDGQPLKYPVLLHILVKKPISVNWVSFLLREDVAKLDLSSCKGKAKSETETLTAQHEDDPNHLSPMGQPMRDTAKG